MLLYYAGGRKADFRCLPSLPRAVLLSYHDIALPAGWFIQKVLLERILAERGVPRKVVVKK
jgi:hypothetical protein